MRKRTAWGSLAIVLVAVGCGGSGPPFPGRVSEGTAALVGTWERRDPSDGRLRVRVTFDANGAFTVVEYTSAGAPREPRTGTFSVSGNIFTVDGRGTDGTQFRKTMPFYVDDRSFAANAFYPVGDHQGIVGSWSTWDEGTETEPDGRVHGRRDTTVVVFRADSTATVTRTRVPLASTERPAPTTYEATYVQSPAGTYSVVPRDGSTSLSTMKLVSIGDAVLASAKEILTRATN